MSAQHSDITPPPELMQQWATQRKYLNDQVVFSEIAQWGADQELEACLRLVEIDAGEDAYDFARYIRAARRPKSQSLKEQALAQLKSVEDRYGLINTDYIRRALEQLND